MVVVVPGSYPPPTTFDASAFNDFLDLRTAVVEHVKRPDIADVFPRLVALAEGRLNRMLRMRQQIASGAVTFSSGRASVPTDLVEIIGLFDASGCEYVQQSPQHKRCGTYSVQGSDLVAMGISGDLTLDYYAALPPLGDSITTSNWLLAKYPDVYLYAVSFEAAKYIRDAELAAATKVLMDDAIATARGDDQSSRYSRARVRVAGVTP